MNTCANQSIGEALRLMRGEAGLTQVQLAERLGKPQSYVAKVESGERSLHVYELYEYSSALDSNAQAVVRRLSNCLARTR